MANKVSLPKGLVDLSTVHCPIIEPTILGLPYHGLVVNGKLTLPNGKVRDYPQPRALSHKTVTYCIKSYWVESPYPGFWTNPGKIITKYERPYIGATILVRGPKAYTPVRTAKEQAEDYKKGYQWKDHAYLSGTLRAIAGHELEPGTSNDSGDGVNGDNTECPSGVFNPIEGITLDGGLIVFGSDTNRKEVSTIAKEYNQGYWLYNDGDTTWLLKWNIFPSTTTVVPGSIEGGVTVPVRTLRIYVIRPFGLFGSTATSAYKKIYEGPYDKNIGNRKNTIGSPVWLPFYSADGSKITISEFWNWFGINCEDTLMKYWASEFVFLQFRYSPAMADNDPTSGDWGADMGELYTWAEIDISGKGSLNKGSVGEGITATVVRKELGIDWTYPGSNSFDHWGRAVCATVRPDGTRGYWYLDSNPDGGFGHLKNTWGSSILFRFPLNHWYADCRNGIEAPGHWVYQGCNLTDDGLMALCYTGNKVDSFTTVHLQTGASCSKGISYDIANNQWSTIPNSCYV